MVRKNDKKTYVSAKNTIKKSNEIALAKLNQGLSLNQMQLLAYAIYATQQNGVTEFNKADFERKFNISNYITSKAEKDVARLMELKVHISNDEEHFKYWNVFEGIEYNRGVFGFEWASRMLPHILELGEKYIRMDLTVTSKFKSSFSWTLYEYIKAHYGNWYKTVEKETLMYLFGVENKKSYKNTAQFKRGVLDVAISEINEHTELDVQYTDIREGKAIVGFKFIWSVGNTIHQATESQLDTIRTTVNTIFDDLFKYLDIKDLEKRERAIELVRQAEMYRELTKQDSVAVITADKANIAIKNLALILKQLEELYGSREESTSRKPESIFYNWIDERE